MPRNLNFRLPRGHRFRPKFDFTVMAPNHGGDPSLRVHLEANGVLFGSKKWIKLVNNYHAPKFEFSTTPQSSISAKIRIQGYGAKSRWGNPRVYLGANGVPLGPKNGSNRKNYHAPRDEFSNTFWPKFDFTVMAPNHGGDPVGSILGPMGSHWVQKMGQNRKKLPCPKTRIFDYPALIDFYQNSTLQLRCQSTVGTP